MTRPKNQIETVEPVESGPTRSQERLACLTIACHPDSTRVGERVFLPRPKKEPQPLSRLEPEFSLVDGTLTAPLEAPVLSRKPTWVSPGGAGGVVISPDPDGSAVAVDGDPLFAPRELAADALTRGVVLELAKRVVLVLHWARPELRRVEALNLVGDSDALEHVRVAVVRFAALDAPVLVRGETGVGKELVARSVHECSRRPGGPWISVNLGAIPPSTAASALFGHAKGAFTGADRDHIGFFQQAQGGTLFLDEVGAASPELQSMLLRVLESGELQPVGARGRRRVDVRVVAATDEDLEGAISDGRFRAPLFHRLSGLVIQVSPLRDRRDDVGRLLMHFMRRELAAVDGLGLLDPPAGGKAPWLSAGLVAKLVRFSWPGNVRQLQNVVRQLVATGRQAEVLDEEQVTAGLLDSQAPAGAGLAVEVPDEAGSGPGEISEQDLVAAMRANRWRINATALALGISRNTLYALIEKSPRLRKAKDIPADEIHACHRDCGGDLGAMVERLEVSRRALQLRLRELELD